MSELWLWYVAATRADSSATMLMKICEFKCEDGEMFCGAKVLIHVCQWIDGGHADENRYDD